MHNLRSELRRFRREWLCLIAVAAVMIILGGNRGYTGIPIVAGTFALMWWMGFRHLRLYKQQQQREADEAERSKTVAAAEAVSQLVAEIEAERAPMPPAAVLNLVP